jgi:hypothetical protein
MITSDSQIIELLSTSFKNMFKDLADRLGEPEVQKWLANSLVNIVEYSGTLPGETRKQRDRRMECHKVYDGDFKELASNLRNTYPNERELSAQELILKVNNGITSIYDVLGASQISNPTTKYDSEEGTSTALDSDKSSTQNVQETAQDVAAQSTSTHATVSSVSMSADKTEVQEHGNGEYAPSVEDTIKESPVKPVQEKSKPVPVLIKPMTVKPITGSNLNVNEEKTTEVTQPTPVEVTKELEKSENKEITETEVQEEVKEISNDVSSTEVHNNNNIKEKNLEENQMSDLNDLMNMANNAINNMGGEEEAGIKPVSNVAASKDQMKEFQIMAINEIEASIPERKAWSQNSRVEALVVLKEPAAKRVRGTMGKLPYKAKGNDAITPEEAIKKRIADFCKAAYGSAIAEEDWKALPEESKYQQVIKVDKQQAATRKEGDPAKVTNLEKAKKTYEVLSNIKNNPTGEFAAFVNDKNVSYNWKGVVIEGAPMNRASLIKTLLDKSNGAVLGDGSDPANTKDAVMFVLGKANDKASAKQQGIAGSTHRSDKKFVVAIKNKANFTDNEAHIVYMYTQPADNSDARASFPVAIKPEGFEPCAGAFSYVRKTEDGQDAYRETKNANATPKYKTGVYTLRVSVPVTDVKKELAEQFKKIEGHEHPTKNAAYWGITIAQDKDFINSDNHIVTMLSSFLSGEIGSVADSDTLQSLEKARKIAQSEADAEEAAQLEQ